MIVEPDFDFNSLGYDVDADELGFVLEQAYPGSKQHVEFICAHRVKSNSAERLTPAIIISWRLPQPEPTPAEIAGFIASFDTEITEFRTARWRKQSFRPLSPRSLWLAALGLGIKKQDVIDTVASLEDEDLRERYTVELTEPPITGYLRDSESVEHIRELMGIPTQQFDDVWLWAQE